MEDKIFRLQYTPGRNSDLRTFSVFLACEDGPGEVEIYRFRHPVTGMEIGVTTFHRRNLQTNIFEPAGEIEWLSNENAIIRFGVEEVSIRDLRKIKKNSQSRRFKADGAVYKWKIANNNIDLFCINSRDKTIATWVQQQNQLRVVLARGENILDRLLVTLVLNLWSKHIGKW